MTNETLEEFIENGGYPTGSTQEIWEQGVREGANYQAERMYSEEEVLELLHFFDSHFNQDELNITVIKKWFEQFKKK
jgi:hypothetical protein